MPTLTPLSPRPSRPSGPVVDLVTAQSRTGRLLPLLGGALLLFLLGIFALRFWLIRCVQKPVGGQLEYLASWCGLPPSLNASLWALAFGVGVLAAWPMMKKLAFLATGVPWFCPKPAEWALLGILPACTLITPVVQTLCPIREIDPAHPETAWFYPDADPASGQVLGRIGYLREADGTWRFYNICTFHRPSDGAQVQRVTPEVRQQWQQDWVRQQELLHRRAAAEQADSAARAALRRQHEERLAQLHLEAARKEAETARAAEAVAAAEKARQEAPAASRRAEQETTSRIAAEKALAETKRQAQGQQAAQTRPNVQTPPPVAQMVRPAEKASPTPPPLPSKVPTVRLAQIPVSTPSTGRIARLQSSETPVVRRAEAPAIASLERQEPLRPGFWRYVHTRGDRVEVRANGPVTLQAYGHPARTYPGGIWVRFEPGPQSLRARPAGPGSTCFFIRPL